MRIKDLVFAGIVTKGISSDAVARCFILYHFYYLILLSPYPCPSPFRGKSQGWRLLPPVIPVQRPVVDRLCQVFGTNIGSLFQVSNGSRYLQDPVEGPGR